MAAASIPLPGHFAGTPGVVRQSQAADMYDDKRSTAQTVEAMARHIRYCANDPYIRLIAADALRTWGNLPASIAGSCGIGSRGAAGRAAWACWWWVKSNLRFKSDDEQLQRLTGERDQLELLITPSVMVRLDDKQGDCDDFTMLICCLLQALGYPWRILTTACDPRRGPDSSSHVFAGTFIDGQLVALDATPSGLFPGWHIPNERMFTLQSWNEAGQKDGQEQYPMTTASGRGLHGYTARRGVGAVVMPVLPSQANARAVAALQAFGTRGMSAIPVLPAQANARAVAALAARHGVRRGRVTVQRGTPVRRGALRPVGMRGFGLDVPDAPFPTDALPSETVIPGTDYSAAPYDWGAPIPGASSIPTGAVSSSAGNNALFAALANETAALTKIFGQTISPQTTIQTPQGLLITGPSGAIAQTSLPVGASSSTGFSSLLMIGAAVVVGIVALKAVSGK